MRLVVKIFIKKLMQLDMFNYISDQRKAKAKM
jgi:hypothetical protein